jgi:hypothetical protein
MRFTKSLGTTVAAIALGAGTVLGAGLVAGTQAGTQQHQQRVVADGSATAAPSPTSASSTNSNDPWD